MSMSTTFMASIARGERGLLSACAARRGSLAFDGGNSVKSSFSQSNDCGGTMPFRTWVVNIIGPPWRAIVRRRKLSVSLAGIVIVVLILRAGMPSWIGERPHAIKLLRAPHATRLVA